MKIAIISDVHNNKINLKKVLDYCTKEKIQTIICCGDLASQETLDFLNDNFSGTIHYTFGNMDNDQLREIDGYRMSRDRNSQKTSDVFKYENTKIYKNFSEIELNGKQVAFVHYPNIARKLCESGKYSFVFYGHTHKPWEKIIGNCKMLNPGNVAGEIYPPTFAEWDTKSDKFKLIKIHSLS